MLFAYNASCETRTIQFSSYNARRVEVGTYGIHLYLRREYFGMYYIVRNTSQLGWSAA